MEVHPIPNHATLPDMPSATNTDHDGRYYTESEVDTMLGDGTVDHGNLAGLTGQGAGGGANDHGLGSDDSPSFAGITLGGLTLTTDVDVGNYDLTAKNFIGDGYGRFDAGIGVGAAPSGTVYGLIQAANADTVEIKVHNETSGKDSQFTWSAVGSSTWCMGIDASATNDPLVICFGTDIGVTVMATFDGTAGCIDFPRAVTATTYDGLSIATSSNRFDLTGDTGNASLVLQGGWDVDAVETVGFKIGAGETSYKVLTVKENVTLDQDLQVSASPTFNGLTVTTMNTYTFDQSVASGAAVTFGAIGCGAITSTGNSLFTGTGGARPITIAQGGDNLGLRVNGYDDMSGNYGLFHLNSAGELSVEAKLGMVLLSGAAGGNYAFNIKSSGNKDVDFNYNNSATGGLRWWGGTNVEKWEVDKDGNMSLAGSLTTGDGGTTNYTAISATGDVSFAGTATVWNDMQFQISDAKVTPASLLPSWEAFTANTSEYAFSVNDEVDTSANEIPHSWKEGTAGHAHIHITTKAVPAQEQKAQFTVTFAYADTSEAWAEAPLTAELTIPISTTALTNFYLDLGNLTLTNYLMEAQIRCRVKRVAKSAGGTEYVGDIFITQVGIHFEEDTIGSKTETAK